MKSRPTAPSHLRKETTEWWSQVINDYDLDAHHVKLLTLAAEAWDRCQQSREAIKRYGMIYKDRFGQPRSRPELAVERDSRLAFARMVRELGLDVIEPKEIKPPTIGGNANRRR